MLWKFNKYLLFWGIFIFIIAGTTLLAYKRYEALERSLVDGTKKHLLTIAKSRAKKLENFIASADINSRLLAQNKIHQQIVAQRLTRKEVFKKFGHYPNALFIDHLADIADSIAIFDDEGRLIDSEPYSQNLIGQDWSVQEDVRNVLDKRKEIICTIQDAFDGQMYVVLTQPIFYDNKFVGMHRAALKTTSLASIIDLNPIEEIGNVYSWIMNMNDTLVYHSNFEYIAKDTRQLLEMLTEPEKRKSLSTVLRQMKSLNYGTNTYRLSNIERDSQKRIVGYYPIKVADKLEWSLAVSQDYHSVSGPIKTHLAYITGTSITIVAATVVILLSLKNLEKKETEIRLKKDSHTKLQNEIAQKNVAEKKLKYILELENFVSRVSTHFLNISPAEVDDEINLSLEKICKLFGSEKAALIRVDNSKNAFSYTHEWAIKEEYRLKEKQKVVNLDPFGWGYNQIKLGKVINFSSLSQLGKEAINEKKIWSDFGLKSVLMVPVMFGAEINGCIVISNFSEEKHWSQEEGEILKILGSIFSSAIVRKNAEVTIRNSEEKYRSIYNCAPLWLVSLDEEGSIFETNERISDYLGYEAADVKGRHFTELIEESCRESIEEYLQKTLKYGLRSKKEFQARKKDGGLIDIIVNSTIINTPGNNNQAIVLIIDNVTERKKIKRQLMYERNLFKTVVDNIPARIFVKDQHCRYTFCNKQLLNAKNLNSVDELTGRTDFDFLPYELANYYFCHEKEMMKTGESITYPDEMRHESGKETWASLCKVPLKNKDGEIAGVVGIGYEITERKLAEKALLKSEKRYRLLFEKMLDGVAIHEIISDDPDYPVYKFVDVNPAFENIVSHERKELVGKNVDDLFTNLDEDWSTVYRQVALEGKSVRFEKFSPILKKYFEIMAYSPEERKLVTVLRDISRQKEFEEQIREYNEELEKRVQQRSERIRELERQRVENEKLAAAGRMAARIAHEINNPLGGVKNAFLLVKDGIPEDFKYYEYVPRIEKEISRMANIIKQLYSLYRPYQEPAKMFSVYDCINDVLSLMKRSCSDRYIRLNMDVGEDCTMVMHEALLRQLLYNLVQNAVEASDEGGEVTVRAGKNSECLCLEVENEGADIPADIKDRIFEPLFTTKSRHGIEGLGIGLSICKNIVGALGGEICYRHDNSKTIFCVLIPCKKSEVESDG